MKRLSSLGSFSIGYGFRRWYLALGIFSRRMEWRKYPRLWAGWIFRFSKELDTDYGAYVVRVWRIQLEIQYRPMKGGYRGLAFGLGRAAA